MSSPIIPARRALAEPPIIGIAAAIANGVADALGADVVEIPLTPWRSTRRVFKGL